MSYVVLARRYRPLTFSELVGQEHVTHTLKNALKTKRTAHAYLFTGPRGVGKTSAARILAKALRCLNPSTDFEPCNKCQACEDVLRGASLDVIEIDAASNTGVDNIRNLRETVEYSAAVGQTKVYIIDEVHMLSTAAFNALLKTLEEPPPNVVFIFATTELHKVLPTIQSRCQRFDFKKITAPVMLEKLSEVCKAEGVTIDEASLRTLVLESEGCMRDAESLLDQAIALCGREIHIEQLEKALSLIDRGSLVELLRLVGEHKPGEALNLTRRLLDKGVDPKVLLGRLVDVIADLHFYVHTAVVRNPDPDLDGSIKDLKAKLSLDEVVRALDLGLRTQAMLATALSSEFTLESFIAKLCLQRPVAQATLPLAHDQAAREIPTRDVPARSVGSASPRIESPRVDAPRLDAPSPSPTKVTAPSTHIEALERFIRSQRPAWTPVLASITRHEVSKDQATFWARNDFAGKRLASADGVELIKKALGVAAATVQLDTASAQQRAPEVDPVAKRQAKGQMAKEHAAVKAAVEIFSATISETKILDDEDAKSKAKDTRRS
jgi:DNA polymerase-3 subunit gamma/tau